MGTTIKELSVLILLMLASLSEGKPLERAKRAIVKDYFNPLTYHTDKLQFEKGEDGKFHETKNDGPVNSKVEYAIAHGIDASNEIFAEPVNSSDQNLQDKEVVVANSEKAGLTPVSSKISEAEHQKESPILSAEALTPDKDKVEVKDAIREKAIAPETTANLDLDTKPDDLTSKSGGSAKLDIPVDSKWTLVPKPDGKDDKPYEGGEDYVPEPPVVPEEKSDGGKVEIGQTPKHHPVFVPPNIPLLIPQRVSFRMLSLFPKPPTKDISDRLPLPEPEVFEESSETAVVENISPGGSKVIKEGRRFLANHLIDPLRFGLQLPFTPIAKSSLDVSDEEKLKGMIKSKVVDIGGRKMLLQRKILLAPGNDPSHFHISVMSLQPLEDIDPMILKDLDKEKKGTESEETSLEKDLLLDEKREAEKKSLRRDTVDTVIKKDGGKRSEVFHQVKADPKIFDGKKPEVIEDVENKKPPAEFLVPTIPVIKTETDKKKGTAMEIDFDLESKMNEEGIEELIKSHTAKELGFKTDVKTESKLDESVEKAKGMEIATIVPSEIKEKENPTTVVKVDKDELIGTDDLLKFRGQAKSQNPTNAHPLTTNVMRGEFGFEKESHEEASESKRIEVTVSPLDESKYNLEKVSTEGKKGDEGMLNAEKVATSKNGMEFVSNTGAKEPTEIPKVESKYFAPDMPEENKEKDMNKKEAVFLHRSTEITTKQVDKEETDIENKESKEFGEKTKVVEKNGPDDILSFESVSHGGKEITASKEADEKIYTMTSGHEELDEKSMTNGKKEAVGVLSSKAVSHDVKVSTSKEDEEKIYIMKSVSEELDEKSMTNGKKEADDALISKAVSRDVKVATSKEDEEKIDIIKSGHEELDKKFMTKVKEEAVDVLGTKGVSDDVKKVTASRETKEEIDIVKIGFKEHDEESMTERKRGDDGGSKEFSLGGMEITENKEKFDIRNLQHSEENNPKVKDLGLKKTEGAILEER